MMSTRSDTSSTLSQQQVQEMLKLAREADKVEIKVVVPMDAHRAAFKQLEIDPIETEPRQVFFFDTPETALGNAGLVVRARRTQGGGGDTTIKLRPVDPTMIDKELRDFENFKVEVDVVPGGFVCSASIKSRCTAQEVLDVTAGGAGLTSLFSKKQRAFYTRHAPANIGLDSLVPFGPTFVLKTKVKPERIGWRLTVELWLFPDGSRNVELSVKAKPSEAFRVAAKLRAFLRDAGIEIVGGQQTKTEMAMAFFGAEINQQLDA